MLALKHNVHTVTKGIDWLPVRVTVCLWLDLGVVVFDSTGLTVVDDRDDIAPSLQSQLNGILLRQTTSTQSVMVIVVDDGDAYLFEYTIVKFLS